MKESNFYRIDTAKHNWEDCLKILHPFPWVFPPGILAASIADNTCASLKFKVTFIYEKQVQNPVLWAWTEDSCPLFYVPRAFGRYSCSEQEDFHSQLQL